MSRAQNTIQQAQDEIVDDFNLFDAWDDRYSYVIDQGEQLPPMPEGLKTDEYKVRGCQSQVWIYPQFSDGVMTFVADSDAPTVKGLIALLLRVYSGHTPAEIAEAEPAFIDRTGLAENLSMLRVNGMRAAAKQIRKYALQLRDAQ